MSGKISAARARVAVLISGNGSNLQALIDASREADYPAEIVLVLSNKADAYGLQRAADAGVATLVLDHRHYPDRIAYDADVQIALRENRIDYVCLAGFMRLLTPGFVAQWQGRMLNIHPSLLPAYKGLLTHQRVLEEGARFTGCSVHFVSAEVDAGPIVIQAALPVLPNESAESLARRVHEAEHRIYPEALRLLASGKLRIVGQRVEIEGATVNPAALFNPSLD